jgi:Protein of unknown function (DUF3800)
MLLFIDESGHDRSGTPCEVLAGVAIAEDNLWNLVRSIRSAERDHFGGYLRELLREETKGKKLLKSDRFHEANSKVTIAPAERVQLANSLLTKGKASRGQPSNNPTQIEIVAYSRQVLDFVHSVVDIAAGFSVQVFAAMVDPNAPRPGPGKLRKDYVYLFERYFYFLETLPPRERGLVVFDELDKAQAHGLLHQMATYFGGTETGRYRSSRIVPEPFFVHSDLTTGVFLADLVAYILGWGWRTGKMPQPARPELRPYALKLSEMQFQGQKPKSDGTGVWQLHGITYLDDLRGQSDREIEDP